MVRDVNVSKVTDTVAELCVLANKVLPDSVVRGICSACKTETDRLGRNIMKDIADNIRAAKELDIPVCQDTGMAIVFIEVGQDVHFVGGSITEAVNRGVSKGYSEGLLRKSVVYDPLNRVNTGNNTPAVLHTKIVDGDTVKITVAPKGFGSENMSTVAMLTPSAGRNGVIKTVLDAVKHAGSNPCPPMIIGVGIGGDFEQSAMLSKIALCRELGTENGNPFYAELEKELLEKINQTGIGPQGFGGRTTALGLNIEYAPTHIAGLPVAVNIGCYVTRHMTKII